MKRFSILLSLLLLIANFSLIPAQVLRFTRENIQITIGNKYAAVRGIYYFRNDYNKEVAKSIFYPFPVNDIFLYPDTILVFDSKENSAHFKKSLNGIHFSLTVPPDSSISIKVKYSQKLLSNEMRYILKTTQNWNHPLLKAEYKISVLKDLELKEISLKPDKQESDSVYNIFYIYKENFMPGDDLIIKWAGRK